MPILNNVFLARRIIRFPRYVCEYKNRRDVCHVPEEGAKHKPAPRVFGFQQGAEAAPWKWLAGLYWSLAEFSVAGVRGRGS